MPNQEIDVAVKEAERAILLLQHLLKFHDEHDLDCIEDGLDDRCPVCLVHKAIAHMEDIVLIVVS
jgi:hypothetical protein